MSWFAWILSVLIVVFALLYVSPKLRKTAFIWLTYVSLTGWYYFRLWEKKRARENAASPTGKTAKSVASSISNSSSSSSSRYSSTAAATTTATQRASSRRQHVVEEDDIEDVVYFESPERLQQRELRNASEQARRLSGSSSSGNSGYSDDSLGKFQTMSSSRNSSSSHSHSHSSSHAPRPPKSHLGIFRSLRKSTRHAHDDDDASSKLRRSDVSDPLVSSTVSEPAMTTRRTYTGRRKKPESWAD